MTQTDDERVLEVYYAWEAKYTRDRKLRRLAMRLTQGTVIGAMVYVISTTMHIITGGL